VADIELSLLRPMQRPEIVRLCEAATHEVPYLRRRAQAVLSCHCGISVSAIMRFLMIGRNTIKRSMRRFRLGGSDGVLTRKRWKKGIKADSSDLRKEVLSILHSPPSQLGFNRTAWTITLLKRALLKKKLLVGKNNVSRIVKNAGFKFWKAKEVLTSDDPKYRE